MRTQASLNKLNKTVEQLEQPLAPLPKLLPILSRVGKTAFIDVEVEQGWRAVQREWLVMLEDKDMAAPVVSALLACELAQADFSPADALAHRVTQANDLGDSGRDSVYGYGAL